MRKKLSDIRVPPLPPRPSPTVFHFLEFVQHESLFPTDKSQALKESREVYISLINRYSNGTFLAYHFVLISLVLVSSPWV